MTYEYIKKSSLLQRHFCNINIKQKYPKKIESTDMTRVAEATRCDVI